MEIYDIRIYPICSEWNHSGGFFKVQDEGTSFHGI